MATSLPIELFEQILKHRLTIDKLTEAISAGPPSDTSTRTSDVSDTLANANPASLKADLENYKEFFSKLRFSYVEQMTKERFLGMITEDPPVVVDTKQNYELDEKLRVAKGELQQRKRKTDELLTDLEALSKKIAPVYEEVTKNMELARRLPEQTAEIEGQIAALNSEAEYGSELHLPLSDTMDNYKKIEAELVDLERKTSALISILPKRNAELDELRREMAVNEASKEGLEKQTSDVVRKRQGDRAAGKADRENTGQWYKSSYETLTALLDQ